MTSLQDLYSIAEQNNIAVDCFELEKREALSLMDCSGSCYIAIDPCKLGSIQDERLKLAHELGHCKTGAFYNQWAARDIRRKHENKADKWAIKKLIPEDELDVAVLEGYCALWDLADYFNVTEDFMRKAVCWYVHGNLAEELYF